MNFPRHRFQTCPKKKNIVCWSCVFLADSSTFFRFSEIHTATYHLKGIMANSRVSLNDAALKEHKTVWLKSKRQFICIEVKQMRSEFDFFDATMWRRQQPECQKHALALYSPRPQCHGEIPSTPSQHRPVANKNMSQHGAHHSVWLAHKSMPLKEVKDD